MIKYTDQMRYAPYNIKKCRKGRKKKTHKYCLDILTFDIEVSSAWMIDGKLRGYHPGEDADFWNSKEKFSLPYIWQFSFNEEVYYGRNIYSFLNLLDDIPKDLECICWIHNLAYEHHAALINLMKVKKLFARSPHSPIYVIYEEYPNITFKCSYTLTNLSLDKWGKQLGLPKLTGELDYQILRTPYTPLFDYELDYCERDCQVVYEGIKDHLKTYEDVFDIPLTSTGKVRRVVKDMLTHDKEYMKEIKRLVPRDIDEYLLFQSVFQGGYTHGNRKYVNKLVEGPIEHVDIASSYPTWMFCCKFPYNKWAYWGQLMPDPSTFEYRAYIVKLHIVNIKVKTWNTYISTSKCHGSGIVGDNGRLLKAREVWLTVTEQDLLTIMETYDFDHIESMGTWVCQKRYLPTVFVKYILKLYEAKTALKGIESEADRYAISKTYINSLYGMSVTNIIQSQVLFTDDCEWIVEELTADMIDYKLNKMKRWFDKSYFLSYPAGCWITAYARRLGLWENIIKIDKDLLYTDTDSLFYLGHKDWSEYNDKVDKMMKAACDHHEIDFSLTRPKDKDGVEYPLGHLTREDDCIAFKTLGAKKYIEKRLVYNKEEERQEEKLFMTISGVNKGAVEVLKGDINEFKDGFIFDKDEPSVHKNEITYLADMRRVVYPDGFVSDLKYGINMRPTGYKLSVPKVVDSLEVILDNFLNPIDQEIIRKRGTLI